MSKAQMAEDAQEFIEEYENIKKKLESLYEDTYNRELKSEIFGLLSVFEEDYKDTYLNNIDIAADFEEEEMREMNRQFEEARS